MIGYDYYNLWTIGHYILNGLNPYSYPISFYPPAAAYSFALLAVLPFQISFSIWTGLNILLLRHYINKLSLGRAKWVWLAFTPVLFIFLTGQIDIFFLWLSQYMEKKGWKPIIVATLLTLKPQIAFIVLPWYLIRWLLYERVQLIRWLGFCIILHTAPLIIDPNIYQKWIHSVLGERSWRILASPGVFALANLQIPIWWMSILALGFVVFGLFRDQKTSQTTQILAIPWGLWYENVLLIGTAPWWLVVPASWAAFAAAYFVHNTYPFTIIPLLIFFWKIIKTQKFKDSNGK